MMRNTIAALAIFACTQVQAGWTAIKSQLTEDELQNDRMMFQIGRAFENAERDADGNLSGGIFDLNIFRRASGWKKDF